MKILISNDGPFAHFYIRLGLAKAFSAVGHEVIMWDINKKPTFDAFDELDPDLFIGQTYNINNSIIKCLAKRPATRVIMKGSDWGKYSDTMDRNRFPVLIANEQEIENVKTLRENNCLDYIYVHYQQKDVDKTHSHWKDIVPALSMLSAADVFEFTGGVSRPEFECDLGFVGGRWGYKSVVLDKWFIPLLKENLNVKIFGNQPWGIPEYCGNLPDHEVKNFFASCKISINLSEPHSQEFGYDIIERPYKLAANKCFMISDHVDGLSELYPDIPSAATPEDFKNLIYYWLSEKADSKEDIVNNNYKITIGSHTYFHRISGIFKNLGLLSEAAKCMNTYDEIKGKLNL